MVLVALVVCAAPNTTITVSVKSLFSVRAYLWRMDPTCLTVTIQTLTFYDCFA